MTFWSSLPLKNSNLKAPQFNSASRIRKEIVSLSLLMKIWKSWKLSSEENNISKSMLTDLHQNPSKKLRNLFLLKCLKLLRLPKKKLNRSQKLKKENLEAKEREAGDVGEEDTDTLTIKKEAQDLSQDTKKKN